MILRVRFLLFALLLLPSCEEDMPVDRQKATLRLTVEDASCTEVWLSASVTDATPPYSIAIQRDGQQVLAASFLSSETTFVDEGLTPNTSYLYTATLAGSSSNPVSGGPVDVTTMDTTSHQWQWQIDTLGVTASSLYDVAIINDTLAYAVGEIYERDSTGNVDPNAYNLVKWDGRMWELGRATVSYRGRSITPPLNGIFAFSPSDIWLSAGVPIHGDGQVWTQYHLFDMGVLTHNDGSINKIWGRNSSDLWFVGNRGTIVHYASGTWTRVESGTTRPLVDVYGARDSEGKHEILIVADGYGNPIGSSVLAIQNGVVREAWSDSRPYGLDAIWFVSGRKYFVVGSGVWETHSPESAWSMVSGLPPIHSTSIRGEDLNDLFISGAFWSLMHFNGLTWQSYFPLASGSFRALVMCGNTIVAVGGASNKAICVRGIR